VAINKGHGIITPFYAATMIKTGDSVHEVILEYFFWKMNGEM
jgi:hypothetical protein